MNEELSKKLLADFPRLFRTQGGATTHWEIECGDGWFDLIYRLSQDIEAVAREGGINPESPDWPLCRRVKEKLGSLHFVVFAVDGYPEISERIRELRLVAWHRSSQICEKCGQPGSLITEGCVATLCPTHIRQSLAGRDDSGHSA